MGRTEVPQGTGMVFLYPADVAGAFWMKNTLVPLSIAFVAADGRVVSVAEMTPCKADPCPSYAPAGPYRYAVELAAGAFGAAGPRPIRRAAASIAMKYSASIGISCCRSRSAGTKIGMTFRR